MVSSEGGFLLENLMDSWAAHEGYSKKEVLDAARLHMFHEDGHSLRFEITQTSRDTMIKVKPRRGSGRGDRGDRGDYRDDRRHRSDRHIGGVKVEESDREDSLPPLREPRTLDEKLDTPLDDLAAPGRHGDRSAASSSQEPFADKASRLHRKMEQMGHTAATVHRRRPPVNADRGGSPRASPRSQTWDLAPRVRKPPMPVRQPPKAREETRSPFVKAPPVKAPPVKAPPMRLPPKKEPGADQGMEVDPRPVEPPLEDDLSEGFEEDEAPDPPPGEHWQEFEDEGRTWYYYDGPKGKWACLGPGHEVTKLNADE